VCQVQHKNHISARPAPLQEWHEAGKRGIWLKVPVAKASLIAPAIEVGSFKFHHAEEVGRGAVLGGGGGLWSVGRAWQGRSCCRRPGRPACRALLGATGGALGMRFCRRLPHGARGPGA
jgi:hypothetical protein